MDDTNQQELIKQLEQLAKDMAEGKVPPNFTKYPPPDFLVQPVGFVSLAAHNRVELGTALPVFANEDYLHAGNLLRLVAPTTQQHVEDIYTAFETIGVRIWAILLNPVDLTLFNANVTKKVPL